jgi:hypothetical protein
MECINDRQREDIDYDETFVPVFSGTPNGCRRCISIYGYMPPEPTLFMDLPQDILCQIIFVERVIE